MLVHRLGSAAFALVVMFLFGLLQIANASAANRVELTILTDRNAPMTAPQDWMRDLSREGVLRLRVQSGRAGQKVGVEQIGSGDSATYRVTAILDSKGQLVFPPNTVFRRGQATAVAKWLSDLEKEGPPKSGERDQLFNLTEDQFRAAVEDLSTKVGFSTVGMKRGQAVLKIAGRLEHPVDIAPSLVRVLDGLDPIEDELQPLASGTAIAYIGNPIGAILVPSEDDGKIRLSVVVGSKGQNGWPVGHPTEKPPLQLLPKITQTLNANVDGATVARVVQAVSERTGTLILFDRRAMRLANIDPAETTVQMRPSRVMYSRLLSQALFQAKLRDEFRIDDAGMPFIWVEPIPMSE